MDLSYDRLLAQIRHEIAKFFLIYISYFGRFGPNKIRLKRRNNLNFIVSTCRSIRPLPYPPVLVSYGMMVGKRHTNKPKAMDDDDSTLSAEGFAFLVNAANEPSISVPQQVVITSYKKASPENNEMEQQRNDATQAQDNETPQTNNPTQHKIKKTTTPKGTSTTVQLQALFETNDDSTQESNKQPHDEDALHDNNPAHQKSRKTTATNETLTSEQNQPSLTFLDNATQHPNNLTRQNNDSTNKKDDATQMNNNPTQNDTKKTKKTRFTWSHPGTNPQCPSTYLVHNGNIKDEMFICRLLHEAPWKAPFGKVTCAWNGLTQKLLSDKHDGTKIFTGANVQTLRKRYQQVYLHLGQVWTKDREKRNQEEASEDDEMDSDQLRSTKQRI